MLLSSHCVGSIKAGEAVIIWLVSLVKWDKKKLLSSLCVGSIKAGEIVTVWLVPLVKWKKKT